MFVACQQSFVRSIRRLKSKWEARSSLQTTLTRCWATRSWRSEKTSNRREPSKRYCVSSSSIALSSTPWRLSSPTTTNFARTRPYCRGRTTATKRARCFTTCRGAADTGSQTAQNCARCSLHFIKVKHFVHSCKKNQSMCLV